MSDFNLQDAKEYCFVIAYYLCKLTEIDATLEFSSRKHNCAAYCKDFRIRIGEPDLESLWNNGGREYATVAYIWANHGKVTRRMENRSGWYIGNGGQEALDVMLYHEFAHLLNWKRHLAGTNHYDSHGPNFQKCLNDILDMV